MLGRPYKLRPSSQRFLNLYLDPLYSQTAICRALSLSKATYFRYEKELNLPKIKIGVGYERTSNSFDLQLSFNKNNRHARYDTNLARLLCKKLGARGKLYFVNPWHLESQTIDEKFDFAIGSLCKTTQRSHLFSFSNHYYRSISASGDLIQLHPMVIRSSQAPILGVAQDTVHEDFSFKYLKKDFEIRSYKSYKIMKKHALALKIDYLLLNKANPLLFLLKDCLNTKKVKTFDYSYLSGIIFKPSRNFWQDSVNKSLDEILNRNEMKEENYFGDL